MVEPSMEDVLDLVGRNLGDKGDTKDRFREFLLKDKWQPEHFEAWIHECTTKGDSSHKIWYNALQDIVVAIGNRLGFEVEFGRYGGSKEQIAFDGLWRRPSGEVILIEVKASGWPVTSVGQLGKYVKRYAESTASGEAEIFGLYVIGDSDVQHLIDQIKGGEYRNVLRLISFKDLVDLWRLKSDVDEIAGKDAGADRVQSILLPIESVNVGNFVRLVLEIAALKIAAAEETIEEAPEEPIDTVDEPWEKAELFSFFRDNTDWQTAVLTVLALTDEEQIPSNRLLRLASRVAKVHIPSISGQTLKSAAGPRGGFKMRRGAKEDFVVGKWGTDGTQWMNFYWIKPQYKEWIREWVVAKGLDIPSTIVEKE